MSSSNNFYEDERLYEMEQQRQNMQHEQRMQEQLAEMEYEHHLQEVRKAAIKEIVLLIDLTFKELLK
jgi:hypothetical protein